MNFNFLTLTALSFVLVLGLSSCGKSNETRTATVIRTGDITYEGCGYLLRMDDDGEMLKPTHLPGAYQHPDIKVTIAYDHTGVIDTCDYSPKIFDVVNLRSINLVR